MLERKRLSLRDAATLLGLTESGVRARFRKGEIAGERDNTGKIWVFIEPAMQVALHPHSEGKSEAVRDALNALKEQLATIGAERDAYRAAADEQTRAKAEIAGLKQQISVLEAERDDLRRRLDAETDDRRKLFAALLTHQADNRPWWRKLLG